MVSNSKERVKWNHMGTSTHRQTDAHGWTPCTQGRKKKFWNKLCKRNMCACTRVKMRMFPLTLSVYVSCTHTHTSLNRITCPLPVSPYLTIWLKCGWVRKCVHVCACRHYSPAAEKPLLLYSILAVLSGLCVWPCCHGDRPCRRASGLPC